MRDGESHHIKTYIHIYSDRPFYGYNGYNGYSLCNLLIFIIFLRNRCRSCLWLQVYSNGYTSLNSDFSDFEKRQSRPKAALNSDFSDFVR